MELALAKLVSKNGPNGTLGELLPTVFSLLRQAVYYNLVAGVFPNYMCLSMHYYCCSM